MRHALWILFVLLLGCGNSGATAVEEAPPRDLRLVEKKLDQLSNQDADPLAAKALAIEPSKWKHAETDHFIIHYRRATEAQKVVREIEFDLWFVARSLGAAKERYAKKSHVYVFQDEAEWKDFLSQTSNPDWFSSFAHGDELFLHVGGIGEGFDSHTLAHETTHAVVARLYPGQRWPRWLNEGFSEYMGSASVAARKGQWTKGLQRELTKGTLPLSELTSMKEYPKDREEIHRFYESSEKLSRFLMNEFPKDRYPQFIDAVAGGMEFEPSIMKVYGDRVKDFASFNKQYERFTK